MNRQFIELLCSPNSKFKDLDFEGKLEAVCKATGLEQTILEDKQMRKDIYEYMSYELYNNKHQLLMASQVQFWNLNKAAWKEMEESETDAATKQVTLHDKITDLMSKLESKIAKLKIEMYGHKDLSDIADEQIKVSRAPKSPEQRLKGVK